MEVANGAGSSGQLFLAIDGVHPSVLVAPPLHQRGLTANYPTWTDANWNSLYLLSAVVGTTALPGIITFEIGGGSLGNIVAIITVAADSTGFADLPVTMPIQVFPPFTLYWECLTYDPTISLGLQAPLETSNAVGVLTLF